MNATRILGALALSLVSPMLASSAAAQSPAEPELDWGPSLVAGGRAGLSGIAREVVGAHVGVGLHASKVRLLALLEYSRDEIRPFLVLWGSGWTLTRTHTAYGLLASYAPLDRLPLHLHAAATWGPVTDTREERGTWVREGSAWAIAGGVGYSFISLTVRGVSEEPWVDNRLRTPVPGSEAGEPTTRLSKDTQFQFLLSATIAVDL